ncbi:MAG: phospholipase D-like domain-containing protein [Chthoniobacter sp.]|nr:phospholipase D-like domain-containing protein [Chthoniobacter sp.]
MSPFQLAQRIVIAVLCVFTIVIRLYVPHVAPSWAGTYEAFAHVFCGILIGIFAANRDRFYVWALAIITALEALAFFVLPCVVVLCILSPVQSKAQTSQTYFAPDDDTLTAALTFAKGSQHTLYVADYSFVWPDLTDALIALHAHGVDVELVLDKTQAAGPSEKPELAKLTAAKVPFLIGTSRTGHIMHHKFMVRDGTAVLAGSFNFTMTAAKENNFFDIVADPARAALFTTEFRKIQDVMRSQAAKRAAMALPNLYPGFRTSPNRIGPRVITAIAP